MQHDLDIVSQDMYEFKEQQKYDGAVLFTHGLSVSPILSKDELNYFTSLSKVKKVASND